MPFAGFDSLAYPGDPVMGLLRQRTNFRFVGYYLAPAPCRGSSPWLGRRATLANQGWGFLPVYVGQQEPGASKCTQNTLTAQQGDEDGRAAVGLMASEGFPLKSVIYLDIEMGGPASTRTLSYVGAWVDAVLDVGTYTPGIYCSHKTAPSILAARPNVPIWTFNLVDLHPNSPSFPTNPPTGSGVAQAIAWQYAQGIAIKFNDPALPPMTVDLDCASVPDPSQLSAPAPPLTS